MESLTNEFSQVISASCPEEQQRGLMSFCCPCKFSFVVRTDSDVIIVKECVTENKEIKKLFQKLSLEIQMLIDVFPTDGNIAFTENRMPCTIVRTVH